MPRAASLAEELKEKFATEAELIPGSKGIFDVKLDGKLIFSKHELDRHAHEGEIAELIQNLK